MFTKFNLKNPHNFERLSDVHFEDIVVGRKGAILVDDLNPIVRTTTFYHNPAQKFLPVHYDLIEQIKQVSDVKFNNALIEIYDDNYRQMGYHSDNALDLAEDSYIGIFSCYDKDPKYPRKLRIKEKSTNKISEIVLDHNSVVLFSVAINSKFLHKIILERPSGDRWLGITFRLSKTYLKFVNGIPYLNDKIFRLATDNERKQFYQLRSVENKSCDFKYPELEYTISDSDLLDNKEFI